jgi:hypothetical protein
VGVLENLPQLLRVTLHGCGYFPRRAAPLGQRRGRSSCQRCQIYTGSGSNIPLHAGADASRQRSAAAAAEYTSLSEEHGLRSISLPRDGSRHAPRSALCSQCCHFYRSSAHSAAAMQDSVAPSQIGSARAHVGVKQGDGTGGGHAGALTVTRALATRDALHCAHRGRVGARLDAGRAALGPLLPPCATLPGRVRVEAVIRPASCRGKPSHRQYEAQAHVANNHM